MTFNPNQGDGAQLMDIMQMQAAQNGYALVDSSEASVTASSGLNVDVASAPSGIKLGTGDEQSFGGASSVSLPDSDPDNPRKAIVYIDDTKTVQTLGSSPAPPEPSDEVREKTGIPTVPIPNEKYLPLAEVWIPAGASTVSNDDIQSRAVPAQNVFGPSGIISMWSGSTNDIPAGWTLCDGTDGTPDLCNRFIAGAGDEYSVGDTGGEKEHQLTESEMPSHTHGYTAPDNNTGDTTAQDNGQNTTQQSTTDSTGNDEAHENRPRFYALAYIMKI